MEYNSIIEEYWEEHGDLETEAFIDLSMDFIDEVHKILENKGWNQKDLALALSKSPAEVSKWLSGVHNMTFKSIAKLKVALEKDIFITISKSENIYQSEIHMKNLGIIKRGESKVVEYNHHEESSLQIAYKKTA